MQRQDYLLRLIQQMGRVLARVREMLLKGEHAEAGEELERTARQAGIDLKFVIALDEDSLLPMLFTGGELDQPKAALFAELVYLEFERAVQMERTVFAARCAERALWLFRIAYEGVAVDDDTAAKMDRLRNPDEWSGSAAGA
jgi:hypothetical protein